MSEDNIKQFPKKMRPPKEGHPPIEPLPMDGVELSMWFGEMGITMNAKGTIYVQSFNELVDAEVSMEEVQDVLRVLFDEKVHPDES